MKNCLVKSMLAATMIAGASFGMSQNIRVSVNNDPVDFAGTEPQSINGRVMVPLRGVFEEMGAFVDWDASNRLVTATQGDMDIRMRIGERYATVDGRQVALDVPAMIVRGRTMVPLRFLSESLGASVEWVPANREVLIMTNGATQRFDNRNNRIDTRNTNMRRIVLESGTVIPVTLDSTLSSESARRGDRFTATVRTNSDDYYGDIPSGTKVEGVVTAVTRHNGNTPGMLELDFRRLRFPDGRTTQIDGSLIDLASANVERTAEGTYRARAGGRDQRAVFAGYGAGAGLIVGLLTKRPLEGAILGGVLGYLAGQLEKDRRQASDVRINSGTQFGVRLDQDLAYTPRS